MHGGVLSIGKPTLLSLPLRCEMSYRSDFRQTYEQGQDFQTNIQRSRLSVVHAKSEEEGR